MSTIKVNTIQTTAGVTLPQTKATLTLDTYPSTSILSDVNVSSVSDLGTGFHGVTFSITHSDAYYCCNITCTDTYTHGGADGAIGTSSGTRLTTTTYTKMQTAGWNGASMIDPYEIHATFT